MPTAPRRDRSTRASPTVDGDARRRSSRMVALVGGRRRRAPEAAVACGALDAPRQARDGPRDRARPGQRVGLRRAPRCSTRRRVGDGHGRRGGRPAAGRSGRPTASHRTVLRCRYVAGRAARRTTSPARQRRVATARPDPGARTRSPPRSRRRRVEPGTSGAPPFSPLPAGEPPLTGRLRGTRRRSPRSAGRSRPALRSSGRPRPRRGPRRDRVGQPIGHRSCDRCPEAAPSGLGGISASGMPAWSCDLGLEPVTSASVGSALGRALGLVRRARASSASRPPRRSSCRVGLRDRASSSSSTTDAPPLACSIVESPATGAFISSRVKRDLGRRVDRREQRSSCPASYARWTAWWVTRSPRSRMTLSSRSRNTLVTGPPDRVVDAVEPALGLLGVEPLAGGVGHLGELRGEAAPQVAPRSPATDCAASASCSETGTGRSTPTAR